MGVAPGKSLYGSSFLGFSREPKLLLAEAGLILEVFRIAHGRNAKAVLKPVFFGAQPALGTHSRHFSRIQHCARHWHCPSARGAMGLEPRKKARRDAIHKHCASACFCDVSEPMWAYHK